MTAKDDFVKEFERVTGKHPNDFKRNPLAVSAILNGYPILKALWDKAQLEATI